MKLVDSSCLICLFNEIDRPYILWMWIDQNYQIVITEQVYEELQSNYETNRKIKPEIDKGNIQIKNLITQNEFEKIQNRYPYLGKGELSIIQTALNLNNIGKKYYTVIDDGRARKVAKQLGINLTGTFGLITTLKDRGCIEDDNFEECKRDLANSNFRINFEAIK